MVPRFYPGQREDKRRQPNTSNVEGLSTQFREPLLHLPLGQGQRENVIKVMRSNTYFCGFSKEKLDVFTAPKSKVNMEEQIETLD